MTICLMFFLGGACNKLDTNLHERQHQYIYITTILKTDCAVFNYVINITNSDDWYSGWHWKYSQYKENIEVKFTRFSRICDIFDETKGCF